MYEYTKTLFDYKDTFDYNGDLDDENQYTEVTIELVIKYTNLTEQTINYTVGVLNGVVQRWDNPKLIAGISKELLLNPFFDLGLDHWVIESGNVTDDDPHDVNTGIILHDLSQVSQSISIEKGSLYELSCDIHIYGISDRFNVYFKDSGTGQTQEIFSEELTASNSSFGGYKVLANSNYNTLYFTNALGNKIKVERISLKQNNDDLALSRLPIFKEFPIEISLFSNDKVTRRLISDGTNFIKPDVGYDLMNNPCEGIYLKWHNSKGGYSYYLFDPFHKESLSSKSIGDVREVYSWVNNTLMIGQETTRTLKLGAKVDEVYFEMMESLSHSNEVYLYTQNKGEKAAHLSWLEVQLDKPKFTWDSRNTLFNVSFTLMLPQMQTRTRI